MQTIDALIEAARTNNLLKLLTLINECVDINQVNSSGTTPLIQATSSGHYAAVEILIQLGAKLEIKNAQGLTAIEVAKLFGHQHIEEMLLRYSNKSNLLSPEELHNEIFNAVEDNDITKLIQTLNLGANPNDTT
ncbi:MAG: ankyrin repeat domain-containing protein, partial [Proteobacteria bacterium]